MAPFEKTLLFVIYVCMQLLYGVNGQHTRGNGKYRRENNNGGGGGGDSAVMGFLVIALCCLFGCCVNACLRSSRRRHRRRLSRLNYHRNVNHNNNSIQLHRLHRINNNNLRHHVIQYEIDDFSNDNDDESSIEGNNKYDTGILIKKWDEMTV